MRRALQSRFHRNSAIEGLGLGSSQTMAALNVIRQGAAPASFRVTFHGWMKNNAVSGASFHFEHYSLIWSRVLPRGAPTED